jgi:branched-subunit amino acid aminotransferase/4-amino-4-deoxychorismate lyase
VYRFVWLNGRVVPADAARVPALSEGFLYAHGAFETMRWFHHLGVFRLRRHVERLCATLAALDVPWEAPTEEVDGAVRETVSRNRVGSDVAVRCTVAANAPGEAPICLIHLRDVGYAQDAYDRGVSATLVERPRVWELARHKTLNYSLCLLETRRARASGFDEALFQDAGGRLLEGAATNLFIVQGHDLVTPSASLPLLPGVAREAVLEAAHRCGVNACERDVRIHDLRAADEAFLTNSVGGVLPLTRVEEQLIGAGRVGPTTRRLWQAYQALCTLELSKAR